MQGRMIRHEAQGPADIHVTALSGTRSYRQHDVHVTQNVPAGGICLWNGLSNGAYSEG